MLMRLTSRKCLDNLAEAFFVSHFGEMLERKLVARYLLASFTVTNTSAASRGTGERGSDSACGVLLSLPLCIFPSPYCDVAQARRYVASSVL
jgi:hypothetical protein